MDYIFNAIVLNKIFYALPVYFGYLTEGQKQMLQRVLYRANCRGFPSHCHDLDTLAESALQHDLFVTVAIVHTGLITCILPNLSHWVP